MAHFIIRSPIITEKSLLQVQQQNVYLFEVDALAHKNQIKHEIEKLFGVQVKTVRTVMQPTQIKRTGKRRSPTVVTPKKKAFVELKDGFKIDLFDILREE